jgi:lysine 2,3-aminomutase
VQFSRRVTPYIEGLESEPNGPIRRQFEPSDEEARVLDYELADPLGEDAYTPVPGLIHRYPNRALVLVTDSCAVHCRYCFRRGFTGRGSGPLKHEEINGAKEYLADHPEIQELLLSGGDPLTLPDRNLENVLAAFRGVRGTLVLRLCTRIPGVQPGRVTRSLCRMLARYAPLWTVFQINHPRELTAAVTAAVGRLVSAGVPVVTQTVLLRGVNDDPGVLAELFQGLVARSAKPYYLLQADLVRGTAHFRVPLGEGLAIFDALKQLVSGLACPVYAVDIPNGGGKIALTAAVSGPENGWFTLTGPGGETGCYPDEERNCVQS